MDKLWNRIFGEYYSVETSESIMDSDEFVKILEEIAVEGTGGCIPNVTMSGNMPEKYQIIFNALEVVSKIGGKTLQDGIDQLRKDYPDKVNALNCLGWGVKSPGRPEKSFGEQRAIVGLVYYVNLDYKNLEATCKKLNIDFKSFKKFRSWINKENKKDTMSHIQNIILDGEGNEIKITSISMDEHIDVCSYMAVLKNKIHLKNELEDIEKKLYKFIELTYNKYSPIKRVY